MTLLKELHKTRDNVLREAPHDRLAMVPQQIGLYVLALELIGKGAPEAPEIVGAFWDALEQLDRLDVRYNHAGSMSGTIALNYPHLQKLFKEHGIAVPFTPGLRQALSASQQPKFISYKNKYSQIVYGTVRCWIFEGPIRL